MKIPRLISVLIIIVLLVLLYKASTEKMTKIYRGVGFYNTGNDPMGQVASGIVNSGIVADYAHTYDEGGYVESCDLCPNSIVCPHCPQFRVTDTGSAVSTLVEDIPVEHMKADMRSECHSAVRMKPAHMGPPLGMFHKQPGPFDESVPETDCRTYNTRANEILYHDIMGLDYYKEPASDECEFFGINGYVYKEPCDMKSIMDEQAKIMCKRSSSNRN